MCTGLEPMFLGLGASAGTAATLATATGIFGASKLAGSLLTGEQSAKVATPEKPPQVAKAPDRKAISDASMMAAMPGGPMAGNAGTFLTGPGGVPSGSLELGKNTLLGQ